MLDIARQMDEDQRSISAHLSSEAGQRQLEVAFLRQSALISSLAAISREIGGSDGWAPLGTAGQLLRKRVPHEVLKLKERYGHRTLKPILMASELFDVRERATAKGGTRTEFRIKPQRIALDEN